MATATIKKHCEVILTLDETEAKILRDVFGEFSYNSLATHLNKKTVGTEDSVLANIYVQLERFNLGE